MRSILYVGGIVTILVLGSCSTTDQVQKSKAKERVVEAASVSIRVYDENNSPLAAAAVVLSSEDRKIQQIGYADIDGIVEFTLFSYCPSCTLRVSLAGFAPVEKGPITVVGGDSLEFDVNLEPSSEPYEVSTCGFQDSYLEPVPEVRGSLTQNGHPVEGALVRLSVLDKPAGTEPPQPSLEIEATTGPDGEFSFQRREVWMLIPPFPVDHVLYWRVCFDISDREPVCSQHRAPDRPGLPDFIHMNCELTDESLCRLSSRRPEPV
jgi:Carboxypeptidase regulatory-like domain